METSDSWVLDLQQYPRPWIGRRKTAVGGLLFGIGLAFTGSIAILNYFIKPTISATDFDNSVLASHDLTRIQKLIGRMTIEEKVGQLNIINMQGLTQNIGSNEDQLLNLVDDADNITLSETIKQVRGGQIGAMFNSRAGAGLYAVLQKVAVEESRLGIPLLFAGDVIHGARIVFPIPLAEAASFEPELARRTSRAAAKDATELGMHWTFAPNVDTARDQRLGRVAEAAGEDTFLGTQFAKARVEGFQGKNLSAEDSLLATPKHFAAYGAVAAGLDYSAVEVSEATFCDVHLPAFAAAFAAGAITTMSTFVAINGVPATANKWLLQDVLRKQLKFPGLVISDYKAVSELIDHGYAANSSHAAKLALEAGCGMDMQSRAFVEELPALVAEGKVSMDTIDKAVQRVLLIKAATGLLDNPYRSLTTTSRGVDHSATIDLAREAAQKSIVLLKNDGNLLPLKKSGQRIALIGPFSDDIDNILGWGVVWGEKEQVVTTEKGISRAMKEQHLLQVVRGCNVETPIAGGINSAIQVAQAADVVLLAIGEAVNFTGEAQSRPEVTIPEPQQQLAEAIAATGKPVVVLLKNGRALSLTGAVSHARAILVTWFLGTQAGHAIADVIFGDFNPSGRLPVSFPIKSGQEPYFYNHASSGRPYVKGNPAFTNHWRNCANQALYPFGYGLSYTRFEYSIPSLSTKRLAWDAALSVSVRIYNIGARDGEEVAQLYVHDVTATRVRPLRELRGFEKISIRAGKHADVTFHLSRHDLAFTGDKGCGSPVVEPGLFKVWVTSSAVHGEPVEFELLSAREAHQKTDGLRIVNDV